MIFPFGPGVDDKSDNPFLPVPIAVAAEEGVQVPLMIGYNTLEAIFLYGCTYYYYSVYITRKYSPDVKSLTYLSLFRHKSHRLHEAE